MDFTQIRFCSFEFRTAFGQTLEVQLSPIINTGHNKLRKAEVSSASFAGGKSFLHFIMIKMIMGKNQYLFLNLLI